VGGDTICTTSADRVCATCDGTHFHTGATGMVCEGAPPVAM
jgi:hypothetical protein